jgi:chromate reductase
VFGGRRFAIIGASPGAYGTTLSQSAWLPVMRTLGVQLWTGGRLMVSRANTVFDESGTLKDATTEEALKQFLLGYVTFLRRTPPPG